MTVEIPPPDDGDAANTGDAVPTTVVITNPPTFIGLPPHGDSKSVIRPKPSSRFGIEVLVDDGESKKSVEANFREQRRAYVELQDGDVYLVRFYNDEDFEVAVDLTIDGVHSFELADDAGFKNSKYLIPPKSTLTAKGWFKNTSEANEFKISGYEGSVAQQQGVSLSEVGVITATFQAAWESGSSPPDSEADLSGRPQDLFPIPPPMTQPVAPTGSSDSGGITDNFGKTNKGESNPLLSVLGDGMTAYYSGNKEEAQQLFTNVIDSGFDDPRAYYFRGIIAFDQGHIDEAVQDWEIGAGIEADSKKDFQIGRSLQRFQGEGRIHLEKIRKKYSSEKKWRDEVSAQLKEATRAIPRNAVAPTKLFSLLESLATSAGRVINTDTRPVYREYGVKRAVISVRYTR